METQLPKHVAYEDETCKFEVQIYGDHLVLHCQVFSWTPSGLKNMYRVFSEFKKEMKDLGYSKLITLTPNPKFAKMFGGATVLEMEHEGQHIEVIVWELKQSH